MQDEKEKSFDDDFVLGKPICVLRWRIHKGKLPLENRHLRALSQRKLSGKAQDMALLAWAKEHIDWTLQEGSQRYPDGVLMLIIDENGHAAMSVGPFEPLKVYGAKQLVERAKSAKLEAETTGIAPELLWAVKDKTLYLEHPENRPLSAVGSLVFDLMKTLGYNICFKKDLAELIDKNYLQADEIFLTSDEFGIVSAPEACGSFVKRLEESLDTLFKAEENK